MRYTTTKKRGSFTPLLVIVTLLLIVTLFFVWPREKITAPVSQSDTSAVFTSETWKEQRSTSERESLVKDLIKNETLTGLDPVSVIQLLGNPTSRVKDDTFFYTISSGKTNETKNLRIDFRKGFAEKVVLEGR